MRRLAPFLFALFLLLTSSWSARAQTASSFPVTDLKVAYEFGNYIFFQARLNLPSAAQEAFLMFRADGESSTRVIPVQIKGGGNTAQRYEISQGAVRPYATIRYQYRVKLQNGQELTSKEFFFKYEDNRFPWQVLSRGGINVHWYAGDQAFGQDALDVAMRGIAQVKKLLLVGSSPPIDIYIYASATDLNQALEIGGVPWVGGHTSPDLRLSLIAIPPAPEQSLEMDRKIPHEIAHVVTYDLMGERYARLPIWLREGIATRVELAVNPDYPRALTQASEQKTLIPMQDLCAAFPPESGRAFLAYAEAQSFTSYIIDKYGQTGMLALTSAYGDGLDCEQGMALALGIPLSKVEAGWRSGSLGENSVLTAFNNLFPYLAIFSVLMTVSLVNALTFKTVKHG